VVVLLDAAVVELDDTITTEDDVLDCACEVDVDELVGVDVVTTLEVVGVVETAELVALDEVVEEVVEEEVVELAAGATTSKERSQ